MRITVRLHTILRRETPSGIIDQVELHLPPGSTVGEAVGRLEIQTRPRTMLLVVNKKIVQADHVLSEGDELRLVPGVSGGSLPVGTTLQKKRAAVEILDQLKRLSKPSNLVGMARFGMNPERRLGISIPPLRRMAKTIGKDHRLALELWKSGIAEARIVASLIDEPARVNEAQMEQWARGFSSWDVCDQVCGNLFDKTPYAWSKARAWARRKEEYVKRAGFALMAYLAWHDEAAPEAAFLRFFPSIRRGAADGRNFVKKAVSWALRNIGKRSPRLRKAALREARALRALDDRTARWVGADVERELAKV